MYSNLVTFTSQPNALHINYIEWFERRVRVISIQTIIVRMNVIIENLLPMYLTSNSRFSGNKIVISGIYYVMAKN